MMTPPPHHFHMSLLIAIIVLMTGHSLLASCVGQKRTDISVGKQLTPFTGEEDATPEDETSLNIDGILASELHSKELYVGLVEVAKHIAPDKQETLILTYNFPEKSDYLEILRCTNVDALRSSHGKNLRDVLQLSDAAQSVEFMTTDLWHIAAKSQKCSMVHIGFEGEEHKVFTDVTAKSGTYYYLVRACVHRERVLDTYDASLDTCTKFVALSENVTYVNKKELADLAALEEATQKGLTLQAALIRFRGYISTAMREYEKCDKEEADRQIRVRRKQARNTLIAAAVSLIGTVTTSLATGGANAYSWKKFFKDVAVADHIATTATSMLNDLTTRPDDFPKTCYAGNQYMRFIEAQVVKIRFLTDRSS